MATSVKPVYQTKYGKEGNCLAASFASILEISLEEIPDIEPDEDQTKPHISWRKKVNRWLNKDFGLAYVEVPPLGSWLWMANIGHHIIGGTSPRDPALGHAVVALNGDMVHDPFGEKGPGLVKDGKKHFGIFLKIL